MKKTDDVIANTKKLSLLKKYGFSEDAFCDDEEYRLFVNDKYADIFIELQREGDKFFIYREFPFADNEFDNFIAEQHRDLFRIALKNAFGDGAEARLRDWYCPYGETEIGVRSSLKEDAIVLFLQVYQDSYIDLADNELDDYTLSRFFESYFNKYNTTRLPGFATNDQGTHAISTRKKTLEKFCKENTVIARIEKIYIGHEYLLFYLKDELFSITLDAYSRFKEIEAELDIDSGNTFELIDSGRMKLLIISNQHFASIHVAAEASSKTIEHEKLILRQNADKFLSFAGKPFYEVKREIDFNKLSANEFESLCFDFLITAGYQEVKSMGQTNAPDGGIDIIATQVYTTLDGEEKSRKVLCQCKRSKKSLNRKDISDIGLLLKKYCAEIYILFSSNHLTQAAIDRLLVEQDVDLSGRLTWYGKVEFGSLLIRAFPELLLKYNL